MRINVIYSNSANIDSRGEELGSIVVLLHKFGDVSLSTGYGLAVFALTTSRRREEVEQALNELNLTGKVTTSQTEREDVDQY